MSRRAAALLVAASLLVLVVAYAVFRRPARLSEEAPAPAPQESAGVAPAPREPFTARLHLPAADGRLGVAEVTLESAREGKARLAAVVTALLAAEPGEGLAALFPEPVRLRGAMLTTEGTAYVDLAGAEGGEPPPGGSTAELQRVYGIVHTVLDNVPEVARVVLLWNGVQRRSLGGHVDTGHPLARFAPLEPREPDAPGGAAEGTGEGAAAPAATPPPEGAP